MDLTHLIDWINQAQNGWEIFGKVAAAIPAMVASLVVLFAAIPGDQPEKALNAFADWWGGVADFVAKYSRKPKE
jgi:hypothetical protein